MSACRTIGIILLYLFIAFQHIFPAKSAEQRCFVCKNIKKPAECNSTILCKEHEACVSTETITPDLELGYHLGCVDSHLCHGEFNPAVGRRSVKPKRTLKHNCCRGDLCNNRTPTEIETAITIPPSTVPPCSDADRRCKDFSFVLQACSSSTEALKCRKTCKLC